MSTARCCYLVVSSLLFDSGVPAPDVSAVPKQCPLSKVAPTRANSNRSANGALNRSIIAPHALVSSRPATETEYTARMLLAMRPGHSIPIYPYEEEGATFSGVHIRLAFMQRLLELVPKGASSPPSHRSPSRSLSTQTCTPSAGVFGPLARPWTQEPGRGELLTRATLCMLLHVASGFRSICSWAGTRHR